MSGPEFVYISGHHTFAHRLFRVEAALLDSDDGFWVAASIGDKAHLPTETWEPFQVAITGTHDDFVMLDVWFRLKQ